MKVKLAEALLRRKELQAKVEMLHKLKENNLCYQIRGERRKVTEGLDEIMVDYPKLEVNQVTREYDFAARQLRLVDGAIQQTNWTADIEVDEMVMQDYIEKK